MVLNTLFSYLKIKCMMNIRYPSVSAVSLCVIWKIHFVKRSKEKKSFSISCLPGRRYNITGSLVCQDGLIYEYLPDSIHHDSFRLHVYFIPSFKSRWPIAGQWGVGFWLKKVTADLAALECQKNWKLFLLNSVAANVIPTAWKIQFS